MLPMALPNYRVRRATVDDLGALTALWESMNFPLQTLEKRLTEFQIAEGPQGHIAGAFGFQINGRYGLIHSEAFSDFSTADEIRSLFWQRIQPLAMNHGVVRLWTQEQSPFWSRNGFQPPTADVRQKLPEAWVDAGPNWLTLQLNDEEVIVSLDKELAMLMQAERERTKETLEKARAFKTVVTVIAFVLVLLIFSAALYVYLRRGTLAVQPP
jgi:N-acetylglutamate synthase-like GNAT family acetyltransferase